MLRETGASNGKGFTLIELMIVIVIIGVLSAIAIPNYLSYRKKGMDESAMSSAKAFYSLMIADFTITGRTAAYSIAQPPVGFEQNSNLTYGAGGITISDAGNGTGGITFQHQQSNTAYTLNGNDGAVSGI
jgi:type IV pilus assembly protein PilA